MIPSLLFKPSHGNNVKTNYRIVKAKKEAVNATQIEGLHIYNMSLSHAV